jgi:membrane protease YdiL (CAAX protease family)
LSHFCFACGRALSSKAAFCSHCGVLTDPAKASQTASIPAWQRRKGSASWEDFRPLLSFYGIVLILFTIFGFIDYFTKGPWVNLVLDILFDSLIISFLAMNWKKVSAAFRLRPVGGKILFELFYLSVLLFFFLKFYFGVFDYFHWPTVHLSESYLKVGWPIWSIFVINAVQPGIFEEIAFRGIIQTRLNRILPWKEALLIQAALFSILHLSVMILVSHFLMGLLLGWVRLKTRQVYWGMLMHMAWNSLVLAQEMYPHWHLF